VLLTCSHKIYDSVCMNKFNIFINIISYVKFKVNNGTSLLMLHLKYMIYKKDPILYFGNVVIVKNLDNIISISCTERRCINRPCNFDVDHFACQRESKDVFIASQYLS